MKEDEVPPRWGARRRMFALSPAWGAGHQGARADTLGSCLHHGVLVTAYFDRLRAFDAANGAPRWDWQLPGRNVLVALSGEAPGGAVLVAHRPDSAKGWAQTAVTALDMASGGEIWSVPQDLSAYTYAHTEPSIFTFTGPWVVVDTGDTAVALDARTGRQGWTVRHAGSGRGEMRAAGDRLVVAARVDGAVRVESFDAADGSAGWQKWPHVDGTADEVRIVATDPLVIAVTTEGRRGGSFLLELDAEGETTRTIPVSAYGDGAVLGFSSPRPVVCGDTVVAVVRTPEEPLLAGYSLSKGLRLWAADGYFIRLLTAHRGHVMAVIHIAWEHEGDPLRESKAFVFDAADGRLVARRRLKAPQEEPFAVHLHGTRMIWVSKETSRSSPPLRVFLWH